MADVLSEGGHNVLIRKPWPKVAQNRFGPRSAEGRAFGRSRPRSCQRPPRNHPWSQNTTLGGHSCTEPCTVGPKTLSCADTLGPKTLLWAILDLPWEHWTLRGHPWTKNAALGDFRLALGALGPKTRLWAILDLVWAPLDQKTLLRAILDLPWATLDPKAILDLPCAPLDNKNDI